MKTLRVAVMITAGTILSSCAANTAKVDEMKRRVAETQPVCRDAKQCEAMWAGARNWVLSNCPMKIQSMTDSYIDTFNPIGNSAEIHCSVTKDPQPDGSYLINARIGCSNIFGCVPNPWDALLAFNQALQAIGQRFATSGK